MHLAPMGRSSRGPTGVSSTNHVISMEWMRYPADRVRLVLDRKPSRGVMSLSREQIDDHLTFFQELIELGRETLPQRTVEAARRALGRSAAALGL